MKILNCVKLLKYRIILTEIFSYVWNNEIKENETANTNSIEAVKIFQYMYNVCVTCTFPNSRYSLASQ